MLILKGIALILVSPTKTAFLLFIVGLFAHFLKRNRVKRLCFAMGFTWLLVFSQPYVANLLLYPLEHSTTSNQLESDNTFAKPKYVLPLACFYQTKGNVPEISRWSECSLQRMLEAMKLAKQHNAIVLLTGGHFLDDSTVNYAEQAAKFYQQQGFPQAQLVIIGEGKNTREELASISQYVNSEPFLVVSSATHQTRLELLLKELKLTASVVTVDYHSSGDLTPHLRLPTVFAMQYSTHALYEYLALVKYYMEAD